MLKKISIIDYIGNSNKDGKPIGHLIKIVNQYIDYFKDNAIIDLYVPYNYNVYVDSSNIHSVINMKCHIDITEKSKFKKILNSIKKFINIQKVFNKNKSDILFFINMDVMLGMALILYHFAIKKKFKIWVVLYQEEYLVGSKLKKKIQNISLSILKKMSDCLILTNENLKFKNKNILYIPDYCYDDKIYSKYKSIKKLNQIVCVGTMNESKELKELVEFIGSSQIKLKLIIKGNFSDKSLFEEIYNKKNENIVVEDIVLDENEYYKLIAESKFVIIPYKQEHYTNKTSGILQETIFLNSIPIAPNFLLNFNNVKGIGYDKINEIETLLNTDLIIPNQDFSIFNNKYNKENIRRKLLNLL